MALFFSFNANRTAGANVGGVSAASAAAAPVPVSTSAPSNVQLPTSIYLTIV